jgi:hypothetical protein
MVVLLLLSPVLGLEDQNSLWCFPFFWYFFFFFFFGDEHTLFQTESVTICQQLDLMLLTGILVGRWDGR